MVERTCRYCGQVFTGETAGEAQAALMTHMRSCPAKLEAGGRDSPLEETERELPPLVERLKECLLREMPRNKGTVNNVVQAALSSDYRIFESDAALRDFLARQRLPLEVVDRVVLALLGYQPRPGEPGQPGTSKEIWYPVKEKSNDGYVTREELQAQMQQLTSSIIGQMRSMLEEYSNQKQVNEQISLASTVSRLEERFNMLEKVESLERKLSERKDDSPEIAALREELRNLKEKSEVRSLIEELREQHKKEIEKLRSELVPGRQPAEYEVRASSLKTVIENLSRTVENTSKQVVPLLENVARIQMASQSFAIVQQLRQAGFSDETIQTFLSQLAGGSQTASLPPTGPKPEAVTSKIFQLRQQMLKSE